MSFLRIGCFLVSFVIKRISKSDFLKKFYMRRDIVQKSKAEEIVLATKQINEVNSIPRRVNHDHQMEPLNSRGTSEISTPVRFYRSSEAGSAE